MCNKIDDLWFLYSLPLLDKSILLYLSHLFNIAFLVAVPCYSIYRKMHFVAGGPIMLYSFSLCCHCANRMHCTHINLNVVCSLCFFLGAPRSIFPVLSQPAIVWVISTIEVCVCRHSGIWYFVSVLYTNRSTYWTTNKQKNTKIRTRLAVGDGWGPPILVSSTVNRRRNRSSDFTDYLLYTAV